MRIEGGALPRRAIKQGAVEHIQLPRAHGQERIGRSMLYSRATIHFDEVARRGSIRKESESLNIAHSGVDRQVNQLEERVGVALFERLPQGLRLTAAGEILIDTIRRGRREIERAEAIIDDLRGLRRGRIAISVAEGAAEFLSRALVEFHETFPNIDFEIEVEDPRHVVASLKAGSSEIGLTFNPLDEPYIRVERSLIYEIGVVTTRDHPLASKDKVMLADLVDHKLIVPGHSITLRSVLDNAWQKKVGEPLRAVVTANSISMMKAAVRAGIGVGLLTRIDVWLEASNGELGGVDKFSEAFLRSPA